MPNIITNSRWTEQPQSAVTIDWGHPISQGIVACWLMNEGAGQTLFDLYGKYPATIVGTTGRAVSTKGKVFNCANANYARAGNVIFTLGNLLDSSGYATKPFSMSIFAQRKSIGTYQDFICKSYNAGQYTGMYFQEANTNKIVFQLINDITTNRYLTVATNSTFTDTKNIHNYLVTYDGSQLASGVSIYEDAIKQATTTIKDTLTNYSVYKSDRNFQIGAEDGSANRFSGILFNAQIWNRVVQPSEAMELYTNPYCFLTPQRTVFYSLPDTITLVRSPAAFM